MKVLITGAAGYVGRRLAPALAAVHEVRCGDLQAPADAADWVTLDVRDFDSVRQALQDIDAVVHLAVASGHEGDYEDPAFNQLRFDVNVKGTWNVLEAARQAGVRRVVYTSSIMVAWGYQPPMWVAADAPPRPVGTYALTKQLGETMCAHYAAAHDLSVICLRISKPIDLDDPHWKERRIRPQWIAFPDLIQAYRLALDVSTVGCRIVTIVGESSVRRWDLEHADGLLGYRPTIRLEEQGYTLGDEREPYA